jgi:hypothetical protein
MLRKVGSLAILLIVATSAEARRPAPAPIHERFATAGAVVVGKVKEIEAKPLSAAYFPGDPDKVEITVALVEIKTALGGLKGATSVRVGFVPEEGGRGRPPQTLEAGQEVLLFLLPHHEQPIHVVQTPNGIVAKKDAPDFDQQLDQLKRCASLLADPMKSLASKDAKDRFETAVLLVYRYRTPPPSGNFKQEAVDGKETKLILQALHDADWANFSVEPTAFRAFNRLGLGPADGWKPAPFADFNKDFPIAAKAWLKDHQDKFVLKRFVPDPNKK